MVHDVTEKSLDRDTVVNTFHPSLKIGVLISFQRSAQKPCVTSRDHFSNYQVRVYFQGTSFLHGERFGSHALQGGLEYFQSTLSEVAVGLLAGIVWMYVATQDYRDFR